MKSYSQCNQDIIIYEKYFKDKKEGIFVDIGAYDGISLSNTYLFELEGWTGVCVEPLVDRYYELIHNRKCECHNALITNEEADTLEFLQINGHPEAEMLSGVIQKYGEKHKKRVERDISYFRADYNIQTIKNYKFNDLIKYTNIDFLSVDTEGCELEILNSIDWTKYQINVITFEDNFREFNLSKSPLNNIYDQWIDWGRGPTVEWDVILKRKE